MSKIKTKFNIIGKSLVLGVSLFALTLLAGGNASANIKTSEVISLVNEARIENGIPVVVEDSTLMKAAQEKAADMTMLQYFSHVSPNGVSPWFWFEKNNYDYRYAGENLAINFTSAQDQQKAWMQSETHKRNILNSNYKNIGVAVKEGFVNGKPAIVTVQLFGTRMKDSADTSSNVSGASTETINYQPQQFKSNPLVSTYILIVMVFIVLAAISLDLVLIIKKQHHKTMIIAHR